VTLRHDLRPGDLGRIIGLHAVVYAREQGYDVSFEAYVAKTIGERSWPLSERDLRGRGLGRALVDEGLAFAREAGYSSVFLWTEDGLAAAASLYLSRGFARTEASTHAAWGGRRTDVRYELDLRR